MSDNEKETQVAEETQNTQATAESSNNDERRGRRNNRGGEGRRGDRRGRREDNHENEMLDRVVTINRVSKTHKGGRTFSFAALVVVGDGNGTVGVGYGKSREVPAAIAKGQLDAKKHLFNVPRIRGTVTHPVTGHDHAGHKQCHGQLDDVLGVHLDLVFHFVAHFAAASFLSDFTTPNRTGLVYLSMSAVQQFITMME